MPTQNRAHRRIARIVAAAFLCVAALAGCSGGDDPAPAPSGGPSGPVISVDAVKAALLNPSDLGQTWVTPDETPPPNTLAALCAGRVPRPGVPGSPATAVASAADEGDAGAQTFDQMGLVYPDAGAAGAARDALHTAVESCPPTVKVSAKATSADPEAGYTESVQTTPLVSGAWSGFAVVRHKQYEASSPGVADTAVTVLASRNVVLVLNYAVYRVTPPSTAPGFAADWQRLVGALVSRVDAKAK
jgi:hypothetical protein